MTEFGFSPKFFVEFLRINVECIIENCIIIKCKINHMYKICTPIDSIET